MTRSIVEPSTLEVIGVDGPEEWTYGVLLQHPGATLKELTEILRVSERTAQRLLDAIEAKGLATRSLERPRRYIPAAPDIVLEALIFKRQESLRRAKETMHKLKERAASTNSDARGDQLVELIANREAERQILGQMQDAAQNEVLLLARPPMLIAALDQVDESELAAVARGVHYRIVVDHDFLSLPGAMERISAGIVVGEDIRIFPRLPFKMIIADRRTALVPLNLKQTSGPVLLVRSSALMDALSALFDIIWERAAPLSFTQADAPGPTSSNAPSGAQENELVHLMATGLNDKSIAHNLDISLRTLERRVADLMRTLGARTRFQAGWAAALRASAKGLVRTPQRKSGWEIVRTVERSRVRGS